MTETIDKMTDAQEIRPAFDHGACTTSNARRLRHRDLQCPCNGSRAASQLLPFAERQRAIRIKSGWRFLLAECLDRLRSIGQERRTEKANKRVAFLRLVQRRMGFDIPAPETLMTETESPLLTRMRKNARIALS